MNELARTTSCAASARQLTHVLTPPHASPPVEMHDDYYVVMRTFKELPSAVRAPRAHDLLWCLRSGGARYDYGELAKPRLRAGS